jgi:hypothetical protein
MKENLAPSCHAIHPGEKIHSSINFEAKLVAFALPNKKESAIRLAKALEHAKSLLLCEKKNNTHSIASSVEDITRYTQKIVDYLSLVKGFLNCKSIISAKSMKNIPPNASGAPSSGGAAAIADLLKTTPPVSVSALNEPLIDPAGMSSPNVAVADISQQDLSCCLNFCDWTDLLSNRTIFALNAKHEYAQTLLATGVQMLVQANTIVDTLMSDRLSEMDEKKLKIAYQLFLHAAGVFDACVIALGVTPRNIGTKPGEVSNAEGLGIPNEEAMAKWRAEQQKKISDSVISHNNNNNIEDEEDTSCRNRTCGGSEEVFSTNRIPDLFEANLPQVFGWISLAQAQELVILRGISREFIDFSLMAKLSIDISYRYQGKEGTT